MPATTNLAHLMANNGEYGGVGVVEISKISVTEGAVFISTSFNRVYLVIKIEQSSVPEMLLPYSP